MTKDEQIKKFTAKAIFQEKALTAAEKLAKQQAALLGRYVAKYGKLK